MLRADGSSNRVMRSAILRNSADPIKDAYAHAADRYQDVLKLEQSVAELHQLFFSTRPRALFVFGLPFHFSHLHEKQCTPAPPELVGASGRQSAQRNGIHSLTRYGLPIQIA